MSENYDWCRDVAGMVRLKVKTTISLHTRHEFEKIMGAELEAKTSLVIIDMERAALMDSDGLGFVFKYNKKFRDAGLRIKLIGVSGDNKTLLSHFPVEDVWELEVEYLNEAA